MLRQRLLTAAVLVAATVAALFALSAPVFALLFGAVLLVGAWEWAALAGVARAGRAAYAAAAAAAAVPLYFAPVLPVLALSLGWWLWNTYELWRLRDLEAGLFASLGARLAGGFLVLLPCWQATAYLHRADPDSPAVILFLFALVWTADSAAYFAGRAFGVHKLAPRVSPGKTIEGLGAGVLAVGLLALAAGWGVWRLPPAALPAWVGLAAVTALFAAAGDLVESRAKRVARVKDSGAWLPGHGGVLDRFDAYAAAAPVFALGSIWLLGLPL